MPLGPGERPRRGAYLTDEVRLFYVLDAQAGRVLLEDCRLGTIDWKPVEEIVRSMRRVRPASPQTRRAAA